MIIEKLNGVVEKNLKETGEGLVRKNNQAEYTRRFPQAENMARWDFGGGVVLRGMKLRLRCGGWYGRLTGRVSRAE